MKEYKESSKVKKGIPQWLRATIFALICTIITLTARHYFFHKGNVKPVNADFLASIEKRKNDPHNKVMVDSGVALLKTGDIVMRRGNDITSDMLSLLSQKDKSYSHCGIVLVENNYPFVYHSIGGEDNPNGRLRRDSAGRWLSPGANVSFGIARLDLKPLQQEHLATITQQFYKEKRSFDMKFDLKTDDKLYCAELVYKAVNLATQDSNYLQPVTVFGYRFVGIDDLYLNKHAHVVCQIRFK